LGQSKLRQREVVVMTFKICVLAIKAGKPKVYLY